MVARSINVAEARETRSCLKRSGETVAEEEEGGCTVAGVMGKYKGANGGTLP